MGKTVVVRRSKPAKELTDDEIKCLEFILDGYTNVDAAFASGLMDPAYKDNPDMRKKATSKVIRLLATKKGQEYMRAHRKLAVMYSPTDIVTVATHMMDICTGQARRTVSVWSESLSETVEYEVGPSFGDQIKAAEWLRKYTTDAKNDARIGSKDTKKIVDADTVALDFVNKWKTRSIDDGVFSHKNGKMSVAGELLNDAKEN